MTKRYYISPIVGTGDEFDPFRPKVADYGVSWVGSIPSNLETGHPLFNWCLVLVNTANHGQLLSDGAIDALPEFPMDGKVGAINTATKNNMIAKMQARGIDTGFINSVDGYRDVIRAIGRSISPAFDENNFDIAE